MKKEVTPATLDEKIENILYEFDFCIPAKIIDAIYRDVKDQFEKNPELHKLNYTQSIELISKIAMSRLTITSLLNYGWPK